MSSPDQQDNPLTRSAPLGGRTGVALASLAPVVALTLFLVVGFLGGWAWSWLFFVAVPFIVIAVYGPRSRRR